VTETGESSVRIKWAVQAAEQAGDTQEALKIKELQNPKTQKRLRPHTQEPIGKSPDASRRKAIMKVKKALAGL
jgi:hypothetical protein